MPPKKTATDGVIQIPTLEFEEVTVALRGRTGLYINRMPAKAKRELLLGGRKKTQAERNEIKHNPLEEYRECMFVDEGWRPHSNIRFPAMALKNAMGTAALATPGIRKTDVSRMVFLPDEYVPIFGMPRLRMTVMRSADINRTPDVRTRPWFENWGTVVTVQYSTQTLTRAGILTLLSNAGVVCGVGDERQEKGKGSAGTFEVADSGDADLDLMKVFDAGVLDRDLQLEAIGDPEAADPETEYLLGEFHAEVKTRSKAVTAKAKGK